MSNDYHTHGLTESRESAPDRLLAVELDGRFCDADRDLAEAALCSTVRSPAIGSARKAQLAMEVALWRAPPQERDQ